MAWQPGERLTVRGGGWRVIRATQFADCEALDLLCERSATRSTLLLPFDRPHRCRSPRLEVTSSHRWSLAVSSLVRTSFPYGGLQFCPAGIRLLPYQLEPALAIFRHGAHRVLVADDVGLGKTVEAGLIVGEVAGGDRLARILILVPAALKQQWQQELASLFTLQTTDAGARWLKCSEKELPPDVNPWSLPGIYLASTDFIKRPEALGPLEDVRWDLLVVDEAHTATPASDRRAAVHALACRSSLVVLLSATPHSGDDEQFAQLCAMGAFSDSAPIVCFSRSRADTPLPSQSVRSRVLVVRPTGAERQMHRVLEDYTSRLWSAAAARTGGNAVLLATVLRKRALSGPSSLAASVRRRLEMLSEAPGPPEQLWLPMDEDIEDAEADSVLAGAGLDIEEDERALLGNIQRAADAAACDESKVRALVRLLRRVREPAVVFSEYRDTAHRLKVVLEEHGHRVGMLHGGLSSEERRQAVAAFTAGGSLLVATDAASEGLNLHGACRLVIHFELPWTPARLHQRCGRVNRIGQTRRVHEIALVADDTAEQLVLVPLVQRAQRSGTFGRGAIMRQLPETRVAAHVLGGAPLPAVDGSTWRTNLVTPALVEEGRQEARRLELLRRLPPPGPSVPARLRALYPIARVRRRHRQSSSAVTLIFSLMIRDGRGTTLDHLVVSIALQLKAWHWQRGAAALRAQVGSLLTATDEQWGGEVQRVLAKRLACVAPLRDAAARAARLRAAALKRELGSTARELVQAGLFDRRALRAATIRARVSQMLTEDTPSPGHQDVLQDPAIRTQIELRAVLCGALE